MVVAALFQKYNKFNPNNNVDYGRLHNGRILGQLFMASTLAHELGRGNEVELHIDEVAPGLPHAPFEEWSASDWEKLQEMLELARSSMLRNDADRTAVDNFERDDSINDKRSKSPLFKKKFEKLLDQINFQKIFVPFRAELQKTDPVDEEVSKRLWCVSRSFYELRITCYYPMISKPYFGLFHFRRLLF